MSALLKKFTCKGTWRQAFICLRPGGGGGVKQFFRFGISSNTHTVKNGYFGKILTLHRKTAKLPICFSDSFFVVDTNIYYRDFRCVYGCWNPSAGWNVLKSRYFSESSLFVPSYFFSVSHEKEGDEYFSGGGEGIYGEQKMK
jgi:hypothetical protein